MRHREENKNYLVEESNQSSSIYRSTNSERTDRTETSREESKESNSESRGTESVTREMMNTIDPKSSFNRIDIDMESNGVIKARAELKTQVKRKERLVTESEELDTDIIDLKDEINEIEKQKLKIKLERKDEKRTEKKKNKKSTETQYLRTDPKGNKTMKKVKDNVDISLKIEDNANQWLKKNERLLTPNTNRKMGDPSIESQSESDSDDPEINKSSAQTKKKYDSKIGPNIRLSQNTGGRKTNSSNESSSDISSDNISSFSESDRNSTRRDLEKTSKLYRDKPQMSQSPGKGKKKVLRKKKKGVKKPNKINFYNKRDSLSDNSEVPKAKKIIPKKGKKKKKKINQ